MPTIIDSLLVRLGLDSSDFQKGQKNVKGELDDLKKKSGETNKSFKELAVGAAKFLGVIGGAVEIKRFIQDQIQANAALQRFSTNLEQSITAVSAWSNIAEQAGGSGEGLRGTLAMLSRSQTELQLTGQSGLIPYFSALGVAMADASGKARPVTDILLDLADRFSHMDRTRAFNMAQMMGFDQGTINLLLRGRTELEQNIRREKEQNAVTAEQGERSLQLSRDTTILTQTFRTLGRDLYSDVSPALDGFVKLATGLGNILISCKGAIELLGGAWVARFAVMRLAVLPFAGVIGIIGSVATALSLLYDDFQTWQRGGQHLIPWERWKPEIDTALNWLGKLKELIRDVILPDWGIHILPKVKNTGANSQNEAAAMQYFREQGWTKEQAAGIVANLVGESALNPGAVGDNGAAYGVAQWHKDRQEAYKKWSGKDIHGSSLADQLAFIQYELTHGSEQVAGGVLRSAKTAGEAGAYVSRFYERPADSVGEAEKRARLARGLLNASQFGEASTNALAGPTAANTTNHNKTENNIGELHVHTNAKNLETFLGGMDKGGNYLFTSQANYGLR